MNIYIQTNNNNYLCFLFGLVIALPVGLSILAIGIISLAVWKCCALKKDRLEFIKFINEQENSKWLDVSALILILCMQEERERDTYPHAHTHTHTHTHTHSPTHPLTISPPISLSLPHVTFALSLSCSLSMLTPYCIRFSNSL
jgi:hypothetical protein